MNQRIVEPTKFDSFGNVGCDDAMARLDNFAAKLEAEPGTAGYLIVYPQRNGLLGRYQRFFDSMKDHLVMTRGIQPERLIVLGGDYRDQLTIEFWLVPKGATLQIPAADLNYQGALKFDEGFADYSGRGAPSLWTYDMCEVEGVYFAAFAEQLRVKPNTKGHIIVHLERGKPISRYRTMARLLRNEMVKEQPVDNRSLVIRSGKPRRGPSVELWIVPI